MSCASIRPFRLVHTRETRHGPPDRRIVIGDPVGVMQGRDDARNDHEPDHCVDQQTASLTWVHAIDSVRLPDIAIAPHEIAATVDAKSVAGTRITR